MKWVSPIFLVFLLASCATLTYNKPPWGTSKEAYLITSIAPTDEPESASMQIYEVPSENKIQLRTSRQLHTPRQLLEVFDAAGGLDSLRGALSKYFEWKEQLKDTGGKVSKPIKEIDVFFPGEGKMGVSSNLHSLVLSFETSQDGKYYLLATEMLTVNKGGGYYSDPMVNGQSRLYEDQVLALNQALSQENILAKAKEADDVANQKAAEETKNQTLQQGLK